MGMCSGTIYVPLSDSLRARRAREVWKEARERGCLRKRDRVGRRRMRYDIVSEGD
jgi:hypothetical protein